VIHVHSDYPLSERRAFRHQAKARWSGYLPVLLKRCCSKSGRTKVSTYSVDCSLARFASYPDFDLLLLISRHPEVVQHGKQVTMLIYLHSGETSWYARCQVVMYVVALEVVCNDILLCSSLFSLFSFFSFNPNQLSLGENGSHPQSIDNIKESDMSKKTTNTKAKMNATQQRIEEVRAKCIAKLKLFHTESWRIITDTEKARAELARMRKGNAFNYGPSLRQPDDSDRLFQFTAFRHFHAPETAAASMDLDDFMASGETFNGPTRLHSSVSYDTFLLIVRRMLNGVVGENKRATDQAHLRMVGVVWSMLRNIETFSSWQDQGTDKMTGATYLHKWPREQLTFVDTYYTLEMVRVAPDDIPEHNRYGTRWVANPLNEDNNFDDVNDNAQDNGKALGRKFNGSDRTMPQFLV
tara:strand:- start:197 stop:1426 length:1230 start_codon:yes stop_codon:yes gene_type:complete